MFGWFMIPRISRSHLSLSLLILLWVLSTMVESAWSVELLLEKGEENWPIRSWSVEEGAVLSLNYTHSLYGGMQREEFRVLRNGFSLICVFFETYEAALYYNENPQGGIRPWGKSGYVICENQFLSEIRFLLTGNTPHFLRIHGESVNLQELAQGGCALRLRILPGDSGDSGSPPPE